MFQPTDQTISGTINITDDNIFEPDETIQFQLSRPTNSPAELGSVRSTTVTIQDNEGAHTYMQMLLYFFKSYIFCYSAVGVVGFEQTTYTFSEDAGTVDVCTAFLQPPEIDQLVFVDLLGSTTNGSADGENNCTQH